MKTFSASRHIWGVPAHHPLPTRWNCLARASASSLLALLLIQPAAILADTPDDHAAPAPADPRPGIENHARRIAARLRRSGKTDPAPYYISYTLYDQSQIVLAGAYGSLLTNSANHRRQVDVTTRVGSPALDNTHGQSRGSGMMSGSIPFGTRLRCYRSRAVGVDRPRLQTRLARFPERQDQHRRARGRRRQVA